jgi:hypothetical protein
MATIQEIIARRSGNDSSDNNKIGVFHSMLAGISPLSRSNCCWKTYRTVS